MSQSRPFMVSLALISGICSTGCPRPIVAPPVGSFPQRPVGGPPSATRVSPRRQTPVPTKRLLSNADSFEKNWKPKGKPRGWKSIVIHHTATNRGSVESIHNSHLRRKDKSGKPWMGIGYHFVIGNGNGMGDGEIEPTFRWRLQLHGAHAGHREHNQRGIGIALIGNFELKPPSSAQLIAVKRLVAALKREYKIDGRNILGHSKIKATACPGKYFPLAEVSQSGTRYLLGQKPLLKSPARLARTAQEIR